MASSVRGGRGHRSGLTRKEAHGPRVAAALDHHVLVQGNLKDKSITQTMVMNEKGPNDTIWLERNERTEPGHHMDPSFPRPSDPDDNLDFLRRGQNIRCEDKDDTDYERFWGRSRGK